MRTRLFVLSTVLSLLLAMHCIGQVPDRGQQLSNREIKVIVDSLNNALGSSYLYPDKAGKMISSINEKFKNGAYDHIKDRDGLSRQLQNDLQQVCKDRHLEIVYDPMLARDVETFLPDTAGNRRAYERDVQAARENNFAFKKAEILPGNIGYLRWDGFYDFLDEAKPVINGAFQFVSNTKALIIDMRHNGGGSPGMVLQLQSCFFHQQVPMNYIIDRDNDTVKRWTDPGSSAFKLDMPVYILTSRSTFSGAEDFCYGLKYAKRAVIVGDTTGGGAHPTRPYSITHGFVAFIPGQRSFNTVTHTDWEGTGVWPDVAVPSDQAMQKAQHLIYEELLSKAADEREKKMLRWLLVSNQNRILLAKQIQTDSITFTKEGLLQYCGAYYTSEPNPFPFVFIVLKGTHIFRHLDNGAEDVRLVPVSPTRFVYDDDSGRTIEFITNSKGAVSGMILETQDGAVRRIKKS